MADETTTSAPASDTPGGVLEGGENIEAPARPASTSEVMTPPAPETENGETSPPPTEKTFTAKQVEDVRKQEKDKLYSRLEQQEETLKELRADLDSRRNAEAKARKEAQEAAKRASEEEMSAKELLEQKDKEWNTRFEDIEARRAEAEALFEKERQYNNIQSFRNRRLQEESDTILPELIDLVTGNSEEEIDASISELKLRSETILNNAASAFQSQQRGMRGASVTAPPVGPSDNEPTYEQLSPQDIKDMPMSEYSKNRDRLMAAVRGRVTEKGLYD